MKISTQFLTDYLRKKDLDWEAFESFSPMAASKKELLIANWRFADYLSIEEVKEVFKTFKGVNVNGETIKGLSFEEFMEVYLNQ